MYYAIGQAAIAVQCRETDESVRKMLGDLDCVETLVRCSAERAFMRVLEGGCSVPLGVRSEIVDGGLVLKGRVTSVDGKKVIEEEESGCVGEMNKEESVSVAEGVGMRLGKRMIGRGARELIASKDDRPE
jgi:hydroxymethylbilane synthase